MKTLINHWIKENLDEIAEKSLLNCHVIGLHSILFTPKIRLFIADVNHELYKNKPNLENLSIGIHPHHCNITLSVIRGKLINYSFKESTKGISINKYLYSSQITNGKSGFKLQNNTFLTRISKNTLRKDINLYLKAEELHTVYVPYGFITAWFVYEGNENPNYEAICYSNSDLDQFDSSKLYKKTSKQDILDLLKLINL